MIYSEILFDISRTDRKAGNVLLAFLPEWEQDGVYIGMCNSWNGNVEVRGPEYSMPAFVYISDKLGNIKPYYPTTEESNNENWKTRLVTHPVVEDTVEETIGDALDYIGELEGKLIISTAAAMDTLRAAIKADEGYAWSWHCNIAMASFDEGLSHDAANAAAARFMKMCFDVDTSEMHKTNDIDDAKVDELLTSFNELQSLDSLNGLDDDSVYNADDAVEKINAVTAELRKPIPDRDFFNIWASNPARDIE